MDSVVDSEELRNLFEPYLIDGVPPSLAPLYEDFIENIPLNFSNYTKSTPSVFITKKPSTSSIPLVVARPSKSEIAQPFSDLGDENLGTSGISHENPASIPGSRGLERPASIPEFRGLERPASIPEFRGLERPASIPEFRGLERPASIPEFRGLERPASIPEFRGLERPASIPEFRGLERPASIPEFRGLERPASIPESRGLERPASIPESRGLETPASITGSRRIERPASITGSRRIEIPASIPESLIESPETRMVSSRKTEKKVEQVSEPYFLKLGKNNAYEFVDARNYSDYDPNTK